MLKVKIFVETEMKSILLMLLLFFGSNAVNAQLTQETKAISPVIVQKLPFGKSMKVGDFQLVFADVVEDSRCPKDVQCIWEGQARIVLKIKKEGEVEREKEIKLHTISAKSPKEIVLDRQLKLQIIGLQPYPVSKKEIDLESYYLQLRVEE